MTFEERMDELAKGQQGLLEAQTRLTSSLNQIAEDFVKGQEERRQAEMRLTNSLNHLVEVQADFEAKFAEARARTDMLLGQALQAIARLANTAHAQNETIAEHDTRIERLEGR